MGKSKVVHGRYYLKKQLATGGFGTVWRAEERVKGQKVTTVAVKEVGNRVDLSEMKILASLKSDYILQYMCTLEQDGNLYMVTEYADGGSADELLHKCRGGLPPKRVQTIIRRIALALAYLHRRNYVHRDVKPENILFVKGQARLGDVGIARPVRRKLSRHTGTQTMEFAAPEMIRDIVGKPSDIYALGITAYRLLTGRYPFSVSQPRAIARWHLHIAPPIPEDLPPYWQDLLARCLDKNPRRRPSAEEVAHLLGAPTSKIKTDRKKPSARPPCQIDRPLRIDETGQEDVMVTIRQVFFARRLSGGHEPDEAVRRVATAMGFGHVGPNIARTITQALNASTRRYILFREENVYYPYRRYIREYSREELKRILHSSMGRVWWDQNEAIYYTARFLGFRRTAPTIREALLSAIRSAIREGTLERDRTDRRWLRWVS